MKLLQRKFAVPSSAGLLATMNEAVGMGFSFHLMCLLVAGSLVYALIEQWGDVSRMKYGVNGKKKESATRKPK